MPRNPVAWHSSMNTRALYLLARATMSLSGATWPSMEKTPSVAMSLCLLVCVAMSLSSRSLMSKCLYLCLSALHSLMPSMIEAWLSASEATTSPRPSTVASRARLAW